MESTKKNPYQVVIEEFGGVRALGRAINKDPSGISKWGKLHGCIPATVQRKVLENKKSYVKDLKQSLVDFEKTGGKKEFFNQVGVQEVELEKEKWEMGEEQFDKLVEEAQQHINKLEEDINEEEKLLDTAGGHSS